MASLNFCALKIRNACYEADSLNSTKAASVAKFRISSYFAQITSIVRYFRKYHSKVLKRFCFCEIEESLKNAILAPSRCRNLGKIVHFLFARTDQRTDISQHTLGK